MSIFKEPSQVGSLAGAAHL